MCSDDLEAAENRYDEAKKELNATIAELNEM